MAVIPIDLFQIHAFFSIILSMTNCHIFSWSAKTEFFDLDST